MNVDIFIHFSKENNTQLGKSNNIKNMFWNCNFWGDWLDKVKFVKTYAIMTTHLKQ